MKKSVLSILILFFTLSGFSQRTDSLWSLYKNTKNDDTTRLSALYELAWDLLYTNPDSTYILGEKHLQLAFEKKLRREESKAKLIKKKKTQKVMASVSEGREN